MSRTRAAEASADADAGFPRRSEPDSLGRFAADLRELRHDAGNPTLHALARATLISKSVISEAFAGHRLPTENTVSRLADALGGDASSWLQRRAELLRRDGSASAVTPPPVSTDSRMPPRRRLVLASVVGALVSVILISAAAWSTPGSQARSETNADAASAASRAVASSLPPARRADPVRTICAEDAVAVVAESHLGGAVLVTLMYSPQCDAVWGQIVKLNDRLDGRAVTVEVFPADDRYGGRRVSATAIDMATVRTGMIRGSSRLEGVCADVTIAPVRGEASPPETLLCM